jgi:diguanylate cyclase (GGDEF)-like protein
MKVLVVEARDPLRESLVEVARDRGHEVLACASTSEAAQLMSGDPPPLAFVADDLPQSGGLELCHRLREGVGAEVVIVILTEAVEPHAVEAALDAGADDYLVKPWSESQLRLRLAIAERRVRDRAARRQSQEELVYEALHDPLTDLVKPAVLLERLERAARGAARRRGRFFAVLALEIDDVEERLRDVAFRDRAVVEISRRLEDCVRSVDTVARSGAHQFAILLDDLRDVSDPSRVASRIHQALSQPVRLGGEEAFLTISIGIALSATGYQAAAELLDNAKEAMRLACGQGPGRHQMYDPVLNARVAARVGLEARLRRAVEREALSVHYQPIVAVADGAVLGFEALAAWNDDEHGAVPPSTFVPVAEDTGLIHQLGWWVFNRACHQLGEWRRGFPRSEPLTMSVNVSGRQFADADVLERVDQTLAAASLDGAGVHVEITESTLMDNVQATQEVLARLKERAVDLHVDDFGTGYSSLSYLCRFPIDALKIDRSFISQMTNSPENLEIVRTIIRLADNLGMRTIAEGVETRAQLDVLRELGCTAAQGYLFSGPMSVEAVAALLRR